MRIKNISITILLVLLVNSPALGQHQNDVWYFGDSLGINFSSGTSKLLLDGVLNITGSWNPDNPGAGDASIADRHTGKLLFYASGHRGIFNSKHRLMAILGDSSWAETVVIVPMGCDTSKYIVCSNDDGWSHDGKDGIFYPPVVAYSIVDMTQNGGDGGIVTQPFELLRGTSDRLTAIPHANGTDSWIISHSLHTKYYYAWHVSSRGVNPTPVLSYSDSTSGYNQTPEDEGFFNTSPNGRKILDIYSFGWPLLLDFDPQTGKVSFNQLIHQFRAIGACYSPDNGKLYAVFGSQGLIQFDIASGKVTTLDSSGFGSKGSVQLGPDGKVYVYASNATWLGVITDPNATGSACNYKPFGFYLGGRKTSFVDGYLPTNMNSFPTSIPAACNKVTADYTATTNCSGRCVSFADWSNGAPTSWKWSFVGGKASADTGASIASVCYDSSGLYPVTLIVNGPNGSDTLVKSILIDIGSRQATCVHVVEHGIPGSTVRIPVDVLVPHSLNLKSAAVSEIDLTLQFNSHALNIQSSDLASRITPPPGWDAKNLEISSGTLRMEFFNTLALPVSDSLNLGEVLFDVEKSNPRPSLVSVLAVEIHTPYDNISLCTDVEGDYLARVIIDTSGTSVQSNLRPFTFSIFPNPIHSGSATIVWSSTTSARGDLSLQDVLGRTLWHETISNGQVGANRNMELPISTLLSNGSYFVRFSVGGEIVTRRLVITH